MQLDPITLNSVVWAPNKALNFLSTHLGFPVDEALQDFKAACGKAEYKMQFVRSM